MRILTISEVYPTADKPQYGVFVKQQVDELKKLGNEIDVLIPLRSKKNGELSESICDSTRVYSVEYRVIRYELFLKGAAKSIYVQLKNLIKQNGYDLLAVHITGDTILKIAVDIGRELGIAVVAHYHGLNVWREFVSSHRYREAYYARRRTRILRKAQALVGVSNKVCDIIRQKITTIPVYTVYNGVETELFYPQDEKAEHFTIIGVGNLIPIKGFKYLIDAFARLYNDDNTLRLKIVGEGSERVALEEQARSLGVSEAVSFLGKLPYDKVAEQMRESHIFALPSFYEALGCVYLEAMACGIPTVGVKGMGIDEIIVDGNNGALTEPKNVEDLTDKLSAIITDAKFAEALGKNGRASALEYTWRASAEKLDSIYRSILQL